ncbi:MAG: DNA polymerase domain-containing protein [Firmicutes bacterium]|nr:DNA polymerase domain-containing protein [Bacillota bacterium]
MWPVTGFTKADLIEYYVSVAPYLLPHLRDRPLMIRRFPDGIEGKDFYQKQCPDHAPDWVTTFPVAHKERVIDYVICNEPATLAWLGNQAAVEIHPWLSSASTLDYPDFGIFDLDPMPPSGWDETRRTALVIRQALSELKLRGWPKASGATGLQVYVPLIPRYTYETVREFVHFACRLVQQAFPQFTTLVRDVRKREGKVYLDYLQNVAGKTISTVYGPRAVPAATVSVPLRWDELESGGAPPAYNLRTVGDRLREAGDLFAPVLGPGQALEPILPFLGGEKRSAPREDWSQEEWPEEEEKHLDRGR